uniref:Uncharacterized protein n=1 Tax=Chelonoidis abingdonii TaxID=106734 RepID=A0A8C0H3W5_CHEAB
MTRINKGFHYYNFSRSCNSPKTVKPNISHPYILTSAPGITSTTNITRAPAGVQGQGLASLCMAPRSSGMFPHPAPMHTGSQGALHAAPAKALPPQLPLANGSCRGGTCGWGSGTI